MSFPHRHRPPRRRTRGARTMRNRFVALGLAVFAILALGAAAYAAKPPKGSTFLNYSIAGTPAQAPAGTVCPGSAACANYAAEPAIRATLDGKFYASSENGLTAGTDAWRSIDGGLHYTSLDCPNCASTSNNTGFAPGGGDTDLAVATAKNAVGNYNAYVASLSWPDSASAPPPAKGPTWRRNPAPGPPFKTARWTAPTAPPKVGSASLTP